MLTISKTVSYGSSAGAELPARGLTFRRAAAALRCDEYGNLHLAVSRLAPSAALAGMKRGQGPEAKADLSDSLAKERSSIRLQQQSETRGLASRVRLIGRIEDEELLNHLARCRVVCFPPLDEDYGFVTVEAFASRKPVITCTDSGGAAELVVEDVNGRISLPRPEELALALRDVMEDPARARRLGEAGYEQVTKMTWEQTLKKLVLV